MGLDNRNEKYENHKVKFEIGSEKHIIFTWDYENEQMGEYLFQSKSIKQRMIS